MEVSMRSNLSDNQRRAICRTAFLLLCVVPTALTIYFATHKRTPDQWAQLLQAELGVQTSIGAVETPLPDELILRDLKLFDNDGQPIFESLIAKVKLGNVNRIHFQSPLQVKRKGLSYFVEEAAQRLVKPDINAKPWEVTFQNLEIISRMNPSSEFYKGFDMNGLHIGWFNGRDGRMVMMECPVKSVTGQHFEDRVWLRLDRNHQSGAFNVSFDTTKNGSVPCWLAKQWFPRLESELGADAEFSGVANIESINATTQCDLTGRFVNVQLPPKFATNNRTSQTAAAIYVNGMRLEDSHWTLGTAAIQMGDNDYRHLANPWQNRPLVSKQTGLFSEVIQAAFHEDIDTTFIR